MDWTINGVCFVIGFLLLVGLLLMVLEWCSPGVHESMERLREQRRRRKEARRNP